MKTITKNKAFTLIEMLVVVLIIGVLAAIALPQYMRSVDQSRLSQTMFVARAMAEGETRHFLANGVWSADISVLDVSFDEGTLGSSKTTVSYPWGYCYTACSNSSCGGCMLQKGGVTVIIFYPLWTNHPPKCFAKTDSERSNEICKVATKKDTDSGTSGIYTIYSFS